jgi:hypothetical protein
MAGIRAEAVQAWAYFEIKDSNRVFLKHFVIPLKGFVLVSQTHMDEHHAETEHAALF